MTDFILCSTCKVDQLAIIMLALIVYIGVCVMSFSSRYIKGDTKYHLFFIHLILLICSAAIMVSSDHLLSFIISCCFSNFILVRLMIHKSKWKAAKASGMIAAKNYFLSIICIASAFALFYFSTGEMTISSIIQQNNQSIFMQIALLLLLVGAMAQSAIWPFHRWLISSLNSPTPVSAIMHAGLINAGGFLLARFSPLYLQHHKIMLTIFLIGLISALLGTLWKLIQSDVKRMLACSTMAQMGFMFVQCGLGLFPLAIAHLFWHGMFKAYLFLASGNAAEEKSLDLSCLPKTLTFICALVCGVFASIVFGYASNKSWFAGDSTLVLMTVVFLTGTQLALSIISTLNFRNYLLASIITFTAALVYGGSTQFIMWILTPMELMGTQPLNIFHISGIIILTLGWLWILFIRGLSKIVRNHSSWMLKGYVRALNSSQPHQDTITSHRNHYQYQ